MNRNALFISTNSFDWDSNAFNGTQMYIIDSTALAAGFLFPNVVYIDIGDFVPTPEGIIGCGRHATRDIRVLLVLGAAGHVSEPDADH